MHRLPQIALVILALYGCFPSMAQQNPHGSDFKVDCKSCHNTGSWSIALDKLDYDHAKTGFALEGRHAKISCSDCHMDLEFKSTSPECLDCHLDVHEMSVGNDCQRCHTTKNWLVQDIGELHEQNAFPLEGAHTTASCIDCHRNGNSLVWERQTGNCQDCHQKDLEGSLFQEMHLDFGTSCLDCHSPFSPVWSAEFYHEFFPLTKGHRGVDCRECHTTLPFSAVDPDCYACHDNSYLAQHALDPNHDFIVSISTQCTLCHTTDPGWSPLRYPEHDNGFVIYGEKHGGQWTKCTDCHLSDNFALFNCTNCHDHSKARMDDKHEGMAGYVFESNSCFDCHPRGRE